MIAAIQGCASYGNESLKAESEISTETKIIVGQTTKNEIKNMFGSPMTTIFTDAGLEIWKYNFSKTSMDAVSFVPVVSIFTSGSSGTQKELTILFDNDDKVKKYNMSESPIKTRTGILAN